MITSKFAITYPTVDVAVIDADRSSVLLGRKQGASGWRFPGGFVDFTDPSLEAAASRELREETGLATEAGQLRYLGSAVIDDPRYRGDNERRILSSLFSVDRARAKGVPKASDDLAEVQFHPLSVLPEILVKEHRPLANLLK